MVHDPLKRVLIVGAGSVGQVYGRHLQLGGAEVRFLVRPQYVEGLQGELPMFRFRGWVRQSVGFRPGGVYSTATEAASGGVDAVELHQQRFDRSSQQTCQAHVPDQSESSSRSSPYHVVQS